MLVFACSRLAIFHIKGESNCVSICLIVSHLPLRATSICDKPYQWLVYIVMRAKMNLFCTTGNLPNGNLWNNVAVVSTWRLLSIQTVHSPLFHLNKLLCPQSGLFIRSFFVLHNLLSSQLGDCSMTALFSSPDSRSSHLIGVEGDTFFSLFQLQAVIWARAPARHSSNRHCVRRRAASSCYVVGLLTAPGASYRLVTWRINLPDHWLFAPWCTLWRWWHLTVESPLLS